MKNTGAFFVSATDQKRFVQESVKVNLIMEFADLLFYSSKQFKGFLCGCAFVFLDVYKTVELFEKPLAAIMVK